MKAEEHREERLLPALYIIINCYTTPEKYPTACSPSTQYIGQLKPSSTILYTSHEDYVIYHQHTYLTYYQYLFYIECPQRGEYVPSPDGSGFDISSNLPTPTSLCCARCLVVSSVTNTRTERRVSGSAALLKRESHLNHERGWTRVASFILSRSAGKRQPLL